MIKYALSVKQSLLFTHLSFVGCQKKYFQKALHIDYEFPEVLYRDGDIFWNFENDVDFNKKLLEKRTLNQAVGNFIRALEKATDHLEKTTHRHPSFNQYIESYLLNMPFLFHFWNVEYLITSQLKKDFKSLFKEAETALQKVLVPSKETYFTRERKSLEKIKKFLDSPRLQIMLEKHIEEFGFTSIVFGIGKPLDMKTLLQRIKSDLSKIEREDKREVQKLLRKLLPNRDVYNRIKLAQELMFWKNQRLDILFKCDYLMISLFTKIAKLMGINHREFLYLTYDEIRKWFKNRSIPAKSILKKRIQGYALYLKNGKISLFLDKKDCPIVKNDKTQIILDSKVLKGNVAYKGKVRGKVKLVFGMGDVKKIEKGDVMVTKMTRPEMIVGLEKAAAFVTDEGGMLSHAAIVAREMKKPCIVGTKFATHILKDGDYVEVDANKGIIKIIAVY